MKKLFIILAVLSLLSAVPAYSQSDTLVILHTNDTHAHLLPWGPKDADGNWMWGGFARLATLVGMNRMQASNVMLVDAGDISVGDFMFQNYLSIAQLQIMASMGYDVMTLGNHEFDLYPTTLMHMFDEAGFPASGFPVLAANLDLSGLPDLGYFVQPYTIKEYGDIKVGIFGLVTESANDISNPAPVVVLPAIEHVQPWIDTLEAHGCDVIILLSHLGWDYDQMVASTFTGIDVIIGGHSHTDIEAASEVGQTIIVTSGAFVQNLGKLSLYFDGDAMTGYDFELQPVNQYVPEYPDLAAMIGGLAAGVEARFGPVYTEDIAVAAVDLLKPLPTGLFKDTPLGNTIADAMREETGTDICFQPQGWISQSIYKGLVRGADIFQAVPYGFDEATGYGFKLATFTASGMSLIYGLEFSVYYLPYSEDFLLQSSNITFAYNSMAEPGSRIDYSSIRINGEPLNPYEMYTVTAPDAVAGVMSQIPGFEVSNLVVHNEFVYTTVRDYMVDNSPVAAYTEGRLVDLAVLADPLNGALALTEVVEQYAALDQITQDGIRKSLLAQLGAVAQYLDAGQPEMAHEALQSFINHVSAQTGKFIDADAAGMLAFLAGELMESMMPGVTALAESPAGNGSAQLRQNHPNPFNPTTSIEFWLPAESHVSLDIYNLLGQRVRTLVDADLAAGAHSIEWNSTDQTGNRVATGIYFYRLSTGSQTVTKKMLLLE